LRSTNSARRFERPVLGVQLAIEQGWIEPGQTILELGAGCLRNARFLQSVLRTPVHAYDTAATVARFAEDYRRFEENGGVVIREPPAQQFERVIVSFVLETLCPCGDSRREVLKTVYRCLRPGGALILSVRGRSDVIDNLNPAVTRYCGRSGGFVTHLHTFVRPYSQDEIRHLLEGAGFTEVRSLQAYRLASPRKLHLVARRPAEQRPRAQAVQPAWPEGDRGVGPLGLEVLRGRLEQREGLPPV
jgi:hypothetical protein